MRNIILFALSLLFFASCKEEKPLLTIEISNPIDVLRMDESINIDLASDFNQKPPAAMDIALFEGDTWIPSQLIDLNGDHIMDNLVFNTTLSAKESKSFRLKYIDKGLMADHFTKNRVNVRLGGKTPPFSEVHKANRVKDGATKKASDLYAMEGPGWENENVAFRNYFDSRNAMDIFGKQTTDMILDKIGHEGSNYHKLESWGMDILKVGSSLGAGAIALQSGDTIYRINDAMQSTYRAIADGPNLGIIHLEHQSMIKGDHKYHIHHQISIAAGTQYYESKVTVDGLQASDKLVTGIVNLHSDSLYIDRSIPGVVIMATHDKQAEDGSHLGMALMIKDEDFAGFVKKDAKTDGISNTYMAKLHINPTVSYRFYSGWELQNKAFATMDGFMKMLKKDALKYSNPIVIQKH